jgi:ATP-dependent Lhr-like helicase
MAACPRNCLDAEQRLKRGELQVLVATASLELGIDIGDVDLVCQIASPARLPPSCNGSAAPAPGRWCPRALFAPPRDDLIECVALLDCVRRARTGRTAHPPGTAGRAGPADRRRSQQPGLATSAAGALRQATPYAELDQRHYQALLRMLAEGYNGRQGVRSAYLHRDAVSGTLRGRRGQLTALTSGGTIPDNADYACCWNRRR